MHWETIDEENQMSRYPHLEELAGRDPFGEWPEVSGPDLDLAEEKLSHGVNAEAMRTFLTAVAGRHSSKADLRLDVISVRNGVRELRRQLDDMISITDGVLEEIVALEPRITGEPDAQ